MLSAVIIEDEVLAAERLRILLQDCHVTLLHHFENPQTALDWLSQHQVDVAFVDIGLPEIDGIQLVERLNRSSGTVPKIIFTTAYEEHALKEFDLAAVDYLLKPIKLTRLQAALQRIDPLQNQDEFAAFKVMSRERMIEIPWQKSRYLIAEEKSVILVTADGKTYDLPRTLIYWEELLADKIVRIHRNALVMRHGLDSLVRLPGKHVDEAANWGAKILDLEEVLPVSRRQLANLRKQMRAR